MNLFTRYQMKKLLKIGSLVKRARKQKLGYVLGDVFADYIATGYVKIAQELPPDQYLAFSAQFMKRLSRMVDGDQ